MTVEPGTLGHRLLWTMDLLSPDTAAVAALQLTCMPDFHATTTARAVNGLEELGLITMHVEHLEVVTCRLTDAGRAELARLGEFELEDGS